MRKREMAERIEELEKRDENATDVLIKQLQANANRASTAGATGLAVIEAAAGLLARGLATAEVHSTPTVEAMLSPAMRHQVGRSLIRRGEFIAWTDGQQIIEAMTGTATGSSGAMGGADRRSWSWELTLPAPSETKTVIASGAETLFVPWTTDQNSPWRGRAPWQQAKITADLLAELEASLRDEAGGPRGGMIGVPDPAASGALAEALRGLKGSIALVPTASSWPNADQSRAAASRSLMSQRLGIDYPESTDKVLAHVTSALAGACGLPPELLTGGASRRESHLRFLAETVEPVGRMLTDQVADVFGTDVELTWPELELERLRQRASIAQMLAQAEVESPAAVAGLPMP